ncbi:MAG: hypothetical protein PHU49_03485 [Syntrophorhabdaceae bacterium]|nr:hypothetical protein [Syntrophorhabdaceae bacterium]MDD5243057.1 hypothetical protein [Syntrophorhabdaceae bacterium]
MKTMQFLWLDDEKINGPKNMASKELEKALKVKIDFIPLIQQKLLDKIQEITEKLQKPDLLIIDYRLDHTSDTNIIGTGSSAAELIRDKDDWKSYPIVAITNVKLNEIDRHKQALYDEVIEFHEISDKKYLLTVIANGFRKLREKSPDDIKQLISLIKPPKRDIENILRIIPEELKEAIKSKELSLPRIIYRWTKQTMVQRPGFLYDRLWVATTLGIKKEAFKKVEPIFERAKYKGIFSLPGNMEDQRWWQSVIKEIVFSEVLESDEVLPWNLGYKLKGLTEKDRSRCYMCGKENPEIVGYTDEDAKTAVPLHISCSMPHPKFEYALYFEEIRMQTPLK